MKYPRNLIIGIVLLLAGLAGLMAIGGSCISMRNMMSGGMMDTPLPRGIDPAELPEPRSAGARLVAHYCTQCHEMPVPGMHAAQAWPTVVNRMRRHMQMMPTVKVPTAEELATLILYLQKHALKPMDKNRYTDLNTDSGKLFETTCSQCHAVPDPKQHTADEWPIVIQRMVVNMKQMEKPLPPQATLDAILGYLQKHAR